MRTLSGNFIAMLKKADLPLLILCLCATCYGIVLIAKGNTVLWLNGNTENMITPENGKWAITITKEK